MRGERIDSRIDARHLSAPQRGGTIPLSSTWRYDGLNRRAESTSSGVVQRYRWCGEEICAVLNGSNQVQTWGYGSRGEVNGGRRLVYGEDHLGSVRQVHDGATGKWLLSVSYHAHGAVKDVRCEQSTDCGLPTKGGLAKGYAGLYPHGPSGLYLGTYRAYDPTAKRWLNRDPIEEEGGASLYSYGAVNPVNFSDPSGYNPAVAEALLACAGNPACSGAVLAAICAGDVNCVNNLRRMLENGVKACKAVSDKLFGEGVKTPEDLVGESTKGRETKGRVDQYSHEGGRE